jgi:predicted nucleic acid-binding protein
LIVLDTSSAVAVSRSAGSNSPLRRRLEADADFHAPHLIDVEFLNALRRLVAAGDLTPREAMLVRGNFDDLLITRYEHQALADRIWDLRHNMSAYDATFIALAEELAAPLVTCDGPLARAPGHRAYVEYFAQ